ncbi:MAG: CPBP family intramembrane glutamic endopeptidase [Phycisphaerae bacterium]|jgi:membrane protease YdiL (CAAX protease family)
MTGQLQAEAPTNTEQVSAPGVQPQLAPRQKVAVAIAFTLMMLTFPTFQCARAAGLIPPQLRWAGMAAGIIILLAGVTVWAKYFRRTYGLFSFRGWRWAGVLLAGLAALQFILMRTSDSLPSGVATWAWAVVFFLFSVGLPEELWFRGIWFALFRNRFLPSVILGSILFGLMHCAPGVPGRGPEIMLMTIPVGLCFAAARYRGAPILCLAIVHAVMDIASTMVTLAGPRFAMGTTLVAFFGGCLLLFAGLLLWPGAGWWPVAWSRRLRPCGR